MICILIPAYNEAEQLSQLLPLIPRQILGLPVRTVVIDDGSTDRTSSVATETRAESITLPQNSGKGVALREGMRFAEDLPYRYLVTMDGDGQHEPRFLKSLIEPVRREDCDLTIGSRYLRHQGRGNTPLNRFIVRLVIVSLLKRILKREFKDPFCGYRCFSRSALENIRILGNRYQGELEVLFEAVCAGLRIQEVAISRIYGPKMTKMRSHGGRLLGRAWVIGQYVATILGKSLQLYRKGLREHETPISSKLDEKRSRRRGGL